MPTLQACCTGIDVQETQLLVVLHLENMAMPTDEELRRMGIDLLTDADIIATGIASDVRHEDIGSLTGPAQLFGIETSQVTAVTVATDSTEGTEILQTHSQFE